MVEKVDGDQVWEETITADEPNCADANTCSTSVSPEVRQAWATWFAAADKVEFSATDASNNLLALFSLLGAEAN